MSEIIPVRRPIDDFEVVFLATIVVIGFVLNIALISRLLTASKQPTVRTSFSAGPYQLNSFALFKLNLCIADFCILLVYALGKVIWLITYDWRLGDRGCKAYQFFSALSFYASSNIIVNIALDRLKQVYNKRPQGATSVRRVRIMLVISWVLATICSIPQLFVWGTMEIQPNWHQCMSIFQTAKVNNNSDLDTIAAVYEFGHQASVFWVPFALTMIAYIIIVVRLLVKHHLPAKKNVVRNCRPTDSDSRTDTSLLGRPRDGSKIKKISSFSMKMSQSWTKHIVPERKRKEVQREYSGAAWRAQLRSRVFRSAMAVVLAHIGLWLPYNFISIMRFVNYDWYDFAMTQGFGSLLEDLIVMNSLLNPLLYGRQPNKRGTMRF